MKLIIALFSVFIAVNFTACVKDQSCKCTTSSSATADGEPFPLYTSTDKLDTYDKKLKDKEADEWCTSYEDSSTTSQSGGGFNYEVFTKTSCTL